MHETVGAAVIHATFLDPVTGKRYVPQCFLWIVPAEPENNLFIVTIGNRWMLLPMVFDLEPL